MNDRMSALPKPPTFRPRTAVAALVAVVALATAGCAGVPVQALSDTRQTIRAAENAGAERAAPEQLAAARDGLRRAEDLLKQREYRAARREAETAHAHAVEALLASPGAHGAAPR
jgi:uncharacterized protein HemX